MGEEGGNSSREKERSCDLTIIVVRLWFFIIRLWLGLANNDISRYIGYSVAATHYSNFINPLKMYTF